MERMGEILARNATNATRRARLRRVASDATRAPAELGGGADAARGEPAADVLPADRILDLPRRAVKGAGRPHVPTGSEGRAPHVAPVAGVEPSQPGVRSTVPSAARRLSGSAALRAASAAARPMTPLREVAQAYLAQRPAQSGSASSTRTTGRSAAAKKQSSLAPDPDVCPHCGGAGYIRLDVPVGDPSFGQAVPCECKEQQKEERRRSDLRRLSSLDPFIDKTFDTFDTSVPGVQEALRVARDYAADPQGWLVLMGGYGAGKTHLAAAIANQRLTAGSPVFFSIVPDLLDHLRAAFGPTSEMPYDEMFDKVREAELLVLDDLGAENSTAWATEKLFQLVNYRYNFRMPTVITTNNRLLSHMDERIRSRLSDLSLVRHVLIEAPDYRERRAGRAPRAGSGSQRRGYTR
jgi:DNA replication protein DnaC